jgi:hypothetical protein
VAAAKLFEGTGVTVLDSPDEDRVRQAVVDERPGGPQVSNDSTGAASWRLHARTLVGMRPGSPVALEPEVVQPALRGSYGREYHWALEAPSTQLMLPRDASHGAVALTEHQTEGRGRLGRTWVDSALMFSVALYPPPPVASWPELTVVAAGAVAAAMGPGATIKDPNDVLVDGRKAAGILAEAAERVVLGIGINVGGAAWPGAGWVDRDRLDLLVDVLERLENAYDGWVSRR